VRLGKEKSLRIGEKIQPIAEKTMQAETENAIHCQTEQFKFYCTGRLDKKYKLS
jgi:hypothetical protein